jgi:hypothetical protein
LPSLCCPVANNPAAALGYQASAANYYGDAAVKHFRLLDIFALTEKALTE